MPPAKRRPVGTHDHHLWTDALHARQRARTTTSEWDRGSYVRWCIQSAWTTFESTCELLLATSGLGMRFKDRLDEALTTADVPAVDWSRGGWQRVLEVYQLRKDYTHPRVPQQRLFAPLAEADRAVVTLRSALEDLYERLRLAPPAWIYDDEADGWQGRRGFTASVHATLLRAGADQDDPRTIRVAYVYKGEEHVSDVLPPDADPEPVVERLLDTVVIPISEVRVYQGPELLTRRATNLRGS